MAVRPAFAYLNGKIVRRDFAFEWNSGFAVSQKRKNIAALHRAIGMPALEISTKSESALGQQLSAFHLTLDGHPLECVYQAGKVLRSGGPYPDLLRLPPREAKRDPRLRETVIGFEYRGERWPLQPVTSFYDYLYILAAWDFRDQLDAYIWFTDIEFNPNRSLATQARSAALLKAVREHPEAMESQKAFLAFHRQMIQA